MLHEIALPSRQYYCGPCAISLLTGVTIEQAENFFRARRRRLGHPGQDRIRGVIRSETLAILRKLGFRPQLLKIHEPTLTRFVKDTDHLSHPCLIRVPGHYIISFKGTVADTVTDAKPIPVENYRNPRRRIRQAWVIVPVQKRNVKINSGS
jgi:hypothetical protein